MVYGYVRVSTEKQSVTNQKYEIEKFCAENKYEMPSWIEEEITGTLAYEKRKLGKLIKKIKKNDILICSELSRLGRSYFMIIDILNVCLQKECKVFTVKENYRLGEDIQSKVLAFAFGISAEIERSLISMRTKEALERKKSEGVVLGRPKGRKSSKIKLAGKCSTILSLLQENKTKTFIAKKLKVHRGTLDKYIKNNNIQSRNHQKIM
jgi:DNA invertase Pin-like site-specific DNA recombinase